LTSDIADENQNREKDIQKGKAEKKKDTTFKISFCLPSITLFAVCSSYLTMACTKL